LALNGADMSILSLNDIFTLSMCIFLGKERLYQIRQTILLIYFLIFITLIFRNIFLDDFDYLYLYYSITSLFAFFNLFEFNNSRINFIFS